MARPTKNNKPVITRREGRFITIAAQRDRGVRIDIQQAIAGGEELHIEVYDYNGRRVEPIEIGLTNGRPHPEFVFRLHELEPGE